MAEQLNVSVTKLRDGAIAASGASAGERVGSAGGHLLSGELRQISSLNGGVGLDHLGCAEGPAAAALSLVLDIGNSALVPPVNGVGELTAGLGLEGGRWGSGAALGHLLVSTGHLGLKLGLREVRELIDSHVPRALCFSILARLAWKMSLLSSPC